MILGPYKLVLSSNSPRRAELLQKSNIPFTKRVVEIDESFPDDLAIDTVAEYIANNKALAHQGIAEANEVILTADTVVAYDDRIYGKPKDKKDAVNTLLTLSDQTHYVYTGVCIFSSDKKESFTVKSEVKLSELTEEEAIFYFEKDKPLDKAGSYGIQDWIGQTKIEWIKGSYTNILGLPMSQTYEALGRFCKG